MISDLRTLDQMTGLQIFKRYLARLTFLLVVCMLPPLLYCIALFDDHFDFFLFQIVLASLCFYWIHQLPYFAPEGLSQYRWKRMLKILVYIAITCVYALNAAIHWEALPIVIIIFVLFKVIYNLPYVKGRRHRFALAVKLLKHQSPNSEVNFNFNIKLEKQLFFERMENLSNRISILDLGREHLQTQQKLLQVSELILRLAEVDSGQILTPVLIEILTEEIEKVTTALEQRSTDSRTLNNYIALKIYPIFKRMSFLEQKKFAG